MTDNERRQAEDLLNESTAFHDAMGLPHIPDRGLSPGGTLFMILLTLASIWVVVYVLFDAGPIAAFFVGSFAYLFWMVSYQATFAIGMEEELLWCRKGQPILSPRKLKQMWFKREAIEKILDHNTDPLEKLMANLENPEYLASLVETYHQYGE